MNPIIPAAALAVAGRSGGAVVSGGLVSHAARLVRRALVVTLGLAALARGAGASVGVVRPLESPAGSGSGQPSLAVDPSGRVYLSWLESRGRSGHTLLLSRLDGDRWSKPQTVAAGDSFVVNWADVPVVRALGNGHLAASWPWQRGADAYDVRVAQSLDDGKTWSAPVTPHRDGTATEHGFVSLLPEGDGVRAVWLDGRNAARDTARHVGEEEHEADMMLRTAVIDAHGGLSDESLLDDRACSCCQTAAVVTPGRVIVAYRDRDSAEVRDISAVRRLAGSWQPPFTVHHDGWRITGCPVNGPAMDAIGDLVAIAWFTEGLGDTVRVFLARSKDGGTTFAEPVQVDDPADGKEALGRVGVALRDNGAAIVSWLDGTTAPASILAREVEPDGTLDEATLVAQTSPARSSGVPRLVRSGNRLVFAWTEVGRPTRVRTAVAALK